MAKKSKIKIHSIQYENSSGELHLATINKADAAKNKISDASSALPPTGDCNCGEEKCIDGIKYRCMADAFGDCVWMVTTERC
jgi:hypothetical protein